MSLVGFDPSIITVKQSFIVIVRFSLSIHSLVVRLLYVKNTYKRKDHSNKPVRSAGS